MFSNNLELAIDFYKDGGIYMFPILLVGLLGLAVILERVIYLFMQIRNINKDTVKVLSGDSKESSLIELTKNNKGVISECFMFYQQDNIHLTRDELENSVFANMARPIRRLSKRVSFISTLANVATLFGLLGTIMGLIQSFKVVSQAAGQDKIEALMSSVSIAMNTTAFGLMVAIPLLLLFVLVQNISNKAVDDLQSNVQRIINQFAR
ncbi:MotA/TolQ/ExbB proton channel family protein [Vibrio mimicus]